MALAQNCSKELDTASQGRFFAPLGQGANNGGSDTLYHGTRNNSVRNLSSFAPHPGEGAKFTPRLAGGKTSSLINSVKKETADKEFNKRLQKLRSQGFYFKIHRFRTNGHVYIYLKARKRVNGCVREITLARIEEKQLEEIKNLIKKVMNGHSHNGKAIDSTRKQAKTRNSSGDKTKAKRSSNTGSQTSTIISSSKPSSRQLTQVHRGNGDRGGVGGSSAASSIGFVLPRFVHRLVLRFVRPWVSPLLLQQLGRPRFIGRSKQWIVRLCVGDKRWVTVQVNRDGTAQVYLEASDNPLTLEEFIGFCRFYLVWLFRRITGRSVDLEYFRVLAAPEFNIDLDGVNLLEGLQARSLTLKKLVSDIVRIYYSGPGVKKTMPNGGTRVEVQPSSYQGMSLKELVEGVAAATELPRFLSSLRKEVEEVKELVKGGVSLKGLEKQSFADLVATRLANYLELLWRRIEERLKQWIQELAGKIADALQSYIDELLQRIRVLEEENKCLRNRIQELEDKLMSISRIDEYTKHPGWKKLLELATPGQEHPALINIDLEKGMVYYSPELWRYIRSRTRNGTIRGLDNYLLNKIKDYHGEYAKKLLLEMQLHGGKISIDKALGIVLRT